MRDRDLWARVAADADGACGAGGARDAGGADGANRTRAGSLRILGPAVVPAADIVANDPIAANALCARMELRTIG